MNICKTNYTHMSLMDFVSYALCSICVQFEWCSNWKEYIAHNMPSFCATVKNWYFFFGGVGVGGGWGVGVGGGGRGGGGGGVTFP